MNAPVQPVVNQGPPLPVNPASSLFGHKVGVWTALVVERIRAAGSATEVDMEKILADAEKAIASFEARFEK